MNDLIPLIRLITKKKISDKYILKSGSATNKQDKLYLAIKNGNVKTDEEAIKYLYGGDASKHAYNRMKRRLKEKLYNSLSTLDQNKQKYTTRKKGHYKVMKLYIVASFLRLEAQYNLQVNLLEDLINQAIKYDLTDFVKLIARQLVKHFSTRSKNDKKLNKYLKLYRKYAKIEEYEFTSNLYLFELSNLFHEKGSKKKLFLNKLKEYGDELVGVQNQINSYDFNYNAFNIASTRSIFEGKYLKTIENADRALEFFSKKPFVSIRDKFSFNSDKIIALILLGKHTDAEFLINNTQKSAVKVKSVNYFNLQYYHFQNYTMSKQYHKLPELVYKVLNTDEISNYNRLYEQWRIREAYIHFLLEAGVLSKDSISQLTNFRQFRIAKFINEVPIYSKEKRGTNVSILVVQILFFIVRQNFNKVIDRIDALKQYSFRYLRQDDTFRSNCFIKMLIKIPMANFHPVLTKTYTEDLFERLVNHKVDVQFITNDIETIPFDDLWGIILNVLKTQQFQEK